jgi:hypothetical protein
VINPLSTRAMAVSSLTLAFNVISRSLANPGQIQSDQ